MAVIPTIDFSSMLKEGDEDGKKKVIHEFGKACLEFGFLQIINHGIPKEFLDHVRDASEKFFNLPIDEKHKCKSLSTIPPAGYGKTEGSLSNKEWLMVCEPYLGFNIFPSCAPEICETMEEMFKQLKRLGEIMESLINEYLGLPADFLKELNNGRTMDALMSWRYQPLPADDDDTNKIGRERHLDNVCFTLLLQDDVSGLEYEKEGSWIPIVPIDDALIFHVGSLIQVLTNKKMMAAPHRVVKPKGRTRHSIVYFYTTAADSWIEPLPQFTKEIGDDPKYKGFFYKELVQERLKKYSDNRTMSLDIDHFAIAK